MPAQDRDARSGWSQEGRGRRDERVGQELLRHDREEILTVETLDDAVLIGSDDRRVAVVDEQGLIGGSTVGSVAPRRGGPY